MNSSGTIGYGENSPLLVNNNNDPQMRGQNSWHLKESTRVDLRKLGVVSLVLFCFASFIALGHVVVMVDMIFTKLNTSCTIPIPSIPSSIEIAPHQDQQQQQPYQMEMTASIQKANTSNMYTTTTTQVLIVHSGGSHLEKLASSVQQGVKQVLHEPSKQLRVRTLEDVTFQQDILWADAIILGTHVINANVEPKMSSFLSTWDFKQDLSQKVGAVFVTSAGISAGEELTMVNLLHSMMIFRMIIVGGERWTSAFGASAIVGEGPFASQHKEYASICYPTDPNGIHEMFQEKAIGLGERVALVATKLST